MSVVSRVEVPALVGALLDRYREYLAVERGSCPLTIRTYLWNARLFVLAACGDDVNRIGALTPGDVARFVTAVSEGRRASTVNTIVVGVRALLRYLYAVGLIATPLAQATPWLARGRVSTLPRTTVPGAARQLLASFDRTTVAGARDFAIVTLMSRLGLRLGEVVDMELDDVDWRRGELLVRSKGGWRDPLPVPVDVGDALTAYLVIRGRDARWRQVFLRIDPPGPMSRTTVLAAIRRGCARVGLADMCSHRLRHTLAVDLLRGGAGLPEIGQVLRHHRAFATTAMYAKVDTAALAAVAQPWPGSRLMSPLEIALGRLPGGAAGVRLPPPGRWNGTSSDSSPTSTRNGIDIGHRCGGGRVGDRSTATASTVPRTG